MLKEISIEFSHLLKKEIGIENVKEVERRNKTEEYAVCCASHDFTDANMVMAEAFERIMGREMKMPGESEELYDFDRRIIEGAWDLAKANNFYL